MYREEKKRVNQQKRYKDLKMYREEKKRVNQQKR